LGQAACVYSSIRLPRTGLRRIRAVPGPVTVARGVSRSRRGHAVRCPGTAWPCCSAFDTPLGRRAAVSRAAGSHPAHRLFGQATPGPATTIRPGTTTGRAPSLPNQAHQRPAGRPGRFEETPANHLTSTAKRSRYGAAGMRSRLSTCPHRTGDRDRYALVGYRRRAVLAGQVTDQDMTAAGGLAPFWLERRSGGRGTRGQHALRQGLQLPDVGFR
jgi:hypothetical protein